VGRVFKLASGVFLLITSVFFLVAGVSHQRYVPVTVHVGDNAITWKTPMKTVKSTLSELGIEVNPQDEVYPSLDAPITQNMHVTIIRRFDISVKDGWVDGGKAKTYTVSAQTVGDALKEIGIELSGADTIVPALDSPIGRGSTITITRRDSYYQTEYELIPYGLWEFSDNRIYEGTSQVWRQGESGTRAKTYLVKRENGVIVSRELVEDVVTKAPKLHVVAKGTKPRYYTLKTPAGNILYTKKITIEATAYYPGPTGKAPAFTLTAIPTPGSKPDTASSLWIPRSYHLAQKSTSPATGLPSLQISAAPSRATSSTCASTPIGRPFSLAGVWWSYISL